MPLLGILLHSFHICNKGHAKSIHSVTLILTRMGTFQMSRRIRRRSPPFAPSRLLGFHIITPCQSARTSFRVHRSALSQALSNPSGCSRFRNFRILSNPFESFHLSVCAVCVSAHKIDDHFANGPPPGPEMECTSNQKRKQGVEAAQKEGERTEAEPRA